LGKEIGKDIISNKKTYLLIKALELAKGTTENALKKWLSMKKFNAEEKVTAVQTIYLSLGIKEITQKAIEEHFMIAIDYLKKVNVDESKKIELKNFLLSLRNRNY
jgi:geranylgeranyl diphosphate synthase type II